MTKNNATMLGLVFVMVAISVVAEGYRFVSMYPTATVIASSLLLAGLGAWYSSARHVDDRRAEQIVRRLVLLAVILVLVVPRLLRGLLGRV